jgi:hypothetical protein
VAGNEPELQRAREPVANGASAVARAPGRRLPVTASGLDQAHNSPDPLAVTDRYKLAAPYSLSSLDL